MAERSAIDWTDATWNPVRGCTKVSPGCKHCYAETLAERFRGVPGHPFEHGFDLRLVPESLELRRGRCWPGTVRPGALSSPRRRRAPSVLVRRHAAAPACRALAPP